MFNNINYICEKISGIKLEDDSQDFGYCLGVLHHTNEINLGLKFCGFELVDILEDLKKIHFADNEYLDLNKWDILEKNNPSIFGNMYQFWCQKN